MRILLIAGAFAAVLGAYSVAACAQASAQSFPSRPIRIVIGFSAGSKSDSLARPMARRLAETIGQQIIIDNRPGASGNIAMEHVAKSPPDGYTVFSGPGSSITTNPHMQEHMPIDVLRDLVPVAPMGQFSAVLVVHPSMPVKSVGELIALAKRKPGPDYEYSGFHGIFAPAATSRDIVDRLNNMIGKVLTVPDVREFYATQNVEVLLMTPAEFSAKVRADHDKWGKIIREAGIKTAN